MSIIQDIDAALAARIRMEREARAWSLSDLAQRSGVSRAMISRIERGEASPTATLLGRLSAAFELTLSGLLARAEEDGAGTGRLMRAEAQPLWRDPATGYVRRAVSPPGATPELVKVVLPPGVTVPFPASTYAHIGGQCIWVMSGELLFQEGSIAHRLAAGDCLALGPPAACAFTNASADIDCVYLVALSNRRG